MSRVTGLLEKFAEHVRKDPWIAARGGVRVVVEERTNWISQVEQALSTAGEILVLVSFGGYRRRPGSGPAILTGTLTVDAAVHENIALNRERPGFATAMQVAEHLAASLHGAAVEGFDNPFLVEGLTPDNASAISVVTSRFAVEQHLDVDEEE